MKIKFKRFNKPHVLKRIGRPLLARFFAHFQAELSANALAVINEGFAGTSAEGPTAGDVERDDDRAGSGTGTDDYQRGRHDEAVEHDGDGRSRTTDREDARS